MSFVHLRTHTEYSVVDSTLRIDDLVEAAAADGQGAVAITDLSNLFGAIKLYSAARKAGVKPIIGADVWMAPVGRRQAAEPPAPARDLACGLREPVHAADARLDACARLPAARPGLDRLGGVGRMRRRADRALRRRSRCGRPGAAGARRQRCETHCAVVWRRCSRGASILSCNAPAARRTRRTCAPPCRSRPNSACRSSRRIRYSF